MGNESCHNCRFGKTDDDDFLGGHVAMLCRRYPPRGLRYESVFRDSWCGEWRKDDRPDFATAIREAARKYPLPAAPEEGEG